VNGTLDPTVATSAPGRRTVAIHPNFVAGATVEGTATVADVNPSDLSDIVGEFAMGDAEQVDAAVAAALEAQPRWAAVTPAERYTALDGVATELLARADELGELLSREEGKPRAEGVGEVQRAAWIFRFFAGEALRVPGEHVRSVRPGVDVDILREPLGVVGIITPWNFPIAIPAWKIAPALAYGNAVVFKPAQLVPASAWALAEILSRAGLPAGTFNLVNGGGGSVGDRLVRHPDVRGVTFTGSQAVGKQVALAGAERFARVQLEMGGKNPLVVLDDADLEVAVDCAVQGAFFQTGQRCTASSRLVVTEGIHDAFVERLVDSVGSLRVGHALADGTQIGPVVDPNQLEQDEDYVRIGREEGAEVLAGGERPGNGLDKGNFYLPTVLAGVDNSARVAQEEIFGPVVTIMRFSSEAEAIQLANDVVYGLAGTLWTQNVGRAHRVAGAIRSGVVTVNTAFTAFPGLPFGGYKQSGFGRELSMETLDLYTELKSVLLYIGEKPMNPFGVS
jgi:alpha-ketoglutaric semialdehyde dehydrogenase